MILTIDIGISVKRFDFISNILT